MAKFSLLLRRSLKMFDIVYVVFVLFIIILIFPSIMVTIELCLGLHLRQVRIRHIGSIDYITTGIFQVLVVVISNSFQ